MKAIALFSALCFATPLLGAQSRPAPRVKPIPNEELFREATSPRSFVFKEKVELADDFLTPQTTALEPQKQEEDAVVRIEL